MNKFLLALLIATGLQQAAHAAPQDEMENLLAQKGLVARLGDRIQSATDRAAELVLNSMGALGVPYRMGGTSADTGFDCSGFVRAMFQQTVGLVLPRRAEEQAASAPSIDKADLKPGDLVFFNTMRRAYSHVGIYVGEGKFIHAPRTGAHVRVENMNISYWQTRFNGARRVLTSDRAGTSTAARTGGSMVTERESPAPRTVRLGGTFGKPAAAGASIDANEAATNDTI